MQCSFTRGHHCIAVIEWSFNPCSKHKWLPYELSYHVDRLTVKKSDPLQSVCKPEGRHARVVASAQWRFKSCLWRERKRGVEKYEYIMTLKDRGTESERDTHKVFDLTDFVQPLVGKSLSSLWLGSEVKCLNVCEPYESVFNLPDCLSSILSYWGVMSWTGPQVPLWWK